MKACIFICLCTLANIVYGQNVMVKQIKDKNLLKVLPDIEKMSIKEGSDLRISLFIVNNGSGSAELSESDEASYTILLTVSEYDENPESHVFSIGPFINPQILDNQNNKTHLIRVEHGLHNQRQINKLIIYSDKVVYQ